MLATTLLRHAVALALVTNVVACVPRGASPTSGVPGDAVSASLRVPATPQGSLEDATVLRAVDGDTIEVQLGNRRARVRYIGVNTPESVAPERPVECFGKEAANRNRELVEGKRVRLERDVSETDRFGRLLRYVWLGDELVNARLVAEGFAEVSTFPPDVRHADLFRWLQDEARTAHRGLWGTCSSPR